MTSVDAPFGVRCELGEGPHWNPGTRRLTYVDINGGAVHTLDPTTGTESSIALAPPVSFAVPVAGTDEHVLGTGGELTLLGASGTAVGRFVAEPDKPRNRFNDGKADPAGRLWFGSMSLDWTPRQSGLYCLDEDGLRTIDDTITLSNGLDWDVERGRMYYIDSTTQRIDVFDYDVATGEVENRTTFAEIDPADGLPDGMTLDAEGCVWLALFQGGVIRRYDPDGAIVDTIALPTTCPTCPTFGGDDLSTMFVTSSRHKLDAAQREAQPLAGAILVVDAGVKGRPGNPVSAAVADALRSET